jgi:putative transposase
MPRHARLDAPGVLHHIIVRGIEGSTVFADNQDRDDFMARMEKIFSDTMTRGFAFALLKNHVHLLLRTGRAPIAKVMARLLTGYAVHFNRRHSRFGPLFQNRYKSILCQEDVYLKELVRYIHLNPLRAGIAKDLKGLSRYRYSGHGAITGKESISWLEREYVVALFGSTKQYVSFVEAGITEGRRPELTGGGLIRSYGGWSGVKTEGATRLKGDERILGDSDFVTMILAHAKETLDRHTAMKHAGIDLHTAETKVCRLYKIDPADLRSKSRRTPLPEARSLFCFFAVSELRTPATTVARYLQMTQPGVGYAAEKGKRIAKEKGYGLLDR